MNSMVPITLPPEQLEAVRKILEEHYMATGQVVEDMRLAWIYKQGKQMLYLLTATGFVEPMLGEPVFKDYPRQPCDALGKPIKGGA